MIWTKYTPSNDVVSDRKTLEPRQGSESKPRITCADHKVRHQDDILSSVFPSSSRFELDQQQSLLFATMLPPAAKSFRCLISPSLPRPGRQCSASIRSTPRQIRKMASSTSEKSRVLEGISFSTNVNASELFLELIPLLKETGGPGRWHLTAQKNGLERRVKFKGFNKCWVLLPRKIKDWRRHVG